jgi:hypothetical protein
MKNLIITLVGILIATSLPGQTQVRSLVSSGGDFAKSSTYTLSESIGESVIVTSISDQFILTQGFQQPDEMDHSVAVFEVNSKLIEVDLYPNPARENIHVRIREKMKHLLQASLVNNSGMILHQFYLDPNGTSVKLSGLPAGSYSILLANQEDSYVGTIRFVKID